MNRFRLPLESHIGHVHLQVSDLERALAFYRDILGFRQVSRDGVTAALSATGQLPNHILLTERSGAVPKPPATTGLYRVAIRFPSRRDLAKVLLRLVARGRSFQGFSDHGVREALYLADPDGNGLELYADRPPGHWPWQDGEVAMKTEPLDIESLLGEAEGDMMPSAGVHPETDIGHVHLHVSDLAQAEAFYAGLLGLEVTARSYPGALFLSAGGYHHHLGVNVWSGVGAPSPPPNAVGLLSFAIYLPDRATWRTVLARMREARAEVEDWRDDEHTMWALLRDPDGNAVELLKEDTIS